MYRNTMVNVDLDVIESNTKNLIKKFNDYEYYFGVIKGNAYGHGEFIVDTLVKSGINYVAVSSLDEALSTRTFNRDIPILCLEPISLQFIDICIKNKIAITIHSIEYFNNLISRNIEDMLKVHIKIDSGMNRLGISDKYEVKKIVDSLMKKENVFLEGIYTHMSTSGINDRYWDLQLDNFIESTKLINLNLIPIVHIDRSLTMMCHPKIPFCNGVRMGISIYGYNQMPIPKKDFKTPLRKLRDKMLIKKYGISKTYNKCDVDLKPALAVYSEIIQIKKVKKGSIVGYGTSYIADNDMTVAIIPIGYADGIDLRNSGRNVYIKNDFYPIIGSVNMGMIIVKVDDNINIDDQVEIIGPHVDIRYVSKYVGTTIYETMTTLSPLLPRVYFKNDKVIHIEK